MSEKAASGKIISFYSYKGGTGRSMALANVAWILASGGHRVLVIDWDLEAPGLHRYFRPFLLDKDLNSSEGVIDMVLEYAVEAITPAEEGEKKPDDWYIPYTNILRYATSLRRNFPGQGRLDFVPAGRQTQSYAARMNSFDWRNFYERLGGGVFLDEVIVRMREEYDYILIDSRTGVSDTSGICTIKMPDALVVCFTLNNQSIEGALSVANSVAAQRGQSFEIYPVATRIENAEKEKLDLRKNYAKERFSQFPAHMTKDERAQFFEDMKIPYVPYYAYEEVLATFCDTPGDTETILGKLERLTTHLTGGAVEWAAPDDAERKRVRALYQSDAAAEQEAPATVGVGVDSGAYNSGAFIRSVPVAGPADALYQAVIDSVFCSYSQQDDKLYRSLANHLTLLKRRGIIAEWNDRRIEGWNGDIDERLTSADLILILISPDFIASDYCYGAEVARAMKRAEAGEARVIPVILRPCEWARTPFGELQALPTGAKPVSQWASRDEALLNVAEGIRKAAEDLNARAVAASTVSETTSIYIPRPPQVGFVGRSSVITRLTEELSPQNNKFVALWGLGGAGKTATAAEVARRLLDAFANRVVWVSVAVRLKTLASMLDEIVTQLGSPHLRSLALGPKEEQTRVLIASAPTLIVIDGFELLPPEEQARFVDFLGRHTICSVLITTRQRMAGPVQTIAIDAISREEAYELLERLIAQTVDPEVFSEEVKSRIVEAAEGSPLILQWVVAQIDMAQEPQVVLDELKHGESEAIERVFARSFNLPQLGEDGRAALLALSLFTPSATREALAAVAGFGDDQKVLNEAVKCLRALWLIRGIDQNRRFAVEGLTRSLAKARLSKDERATVFIRRFAAYFSSYAEERAKPSPENYDELEAEKGNLLCAVDRAFGIQDWESVMRIRDILEDFLFTRGYWDEAIRSGEQAESAARATNNDFMASYFTTCVANIRMHRGEYVEAEMAYQKALEISRRLGHENNVAVCLHQLGTLALSQGDLKKARHLYAESLEIKKRGGDQGGIGLTLHQLGRLAQEQGELDEARWLYNESLGITQKLGNLSSIAATLRQQGAVALQQGNPEEARELSRKSLEINTRLGDQIGMARTHYQLGCIAEWEDHLDEASSHFKESLEISKKLGNRQGIALTLFELGVIARERGDKTEAAGFFREALAIFEVLGSPHAEKSRAALLSVEGGGQ